MLGPERTGVFFVIRLIYNEKKACHLIELLSSNNNLPKASLRINSTHIRDGFNRPVKVNFQNTVSSVAGIIPAFHKLRDVNFFDRLLEPL